MIGQLPKSVEIAENIYDIRYDFRDCLNILIAFTDNDLEDYEKMYVALTIFYIDKIPEEHINEAYEKMIWFLNLGDKLSDTNINKAKLYDWEQDEQVIFAAVNKVAGYETREKEKLHFWTFINYFYEVGDSTFAYITRIRDKLNHSEKLDDIEKKYYKENKDMIVLAAKYSKKEQDIINQINELLK